MSMKPSEEPIRPPEVTDLFVVVNWADRRIVGGVRRLSETELEITIPRPDEELPRPGAVLHELFIGMPRLHCDLPRLTVRRHIVDENETVTMVLEATDSDARSSLWEMQQKLERLAREDTEAPPPPGDIPRIPARGHYSEDARLERLEWLRLQTGAPLRQLQCSDLPAE